MKPRYSFSSRHTGKLTNIKKQREKYPSVTKRIVDTSDIILEVVDARFIERTRNLQIEKEIKKQKKKLIIVINKSDLAEKIQKPENESYIIISAKNREGIKKLRDLIKMESSCLEKIEKRFMKKEKVRIDKNPKKITVGVVGYPNTGKSSLINSLAGKSSAPVSNQSGFTKGFQKIKLTSTIQLIDSPGVIEESKYSSDNQKLIAEHTIVGSRGYSQVKDPELVINQIMQTYPGLLEKKYKIKANGNSDFLLEELGKQREFLKKGNEINADQTARSIIKDWQEGNIKN